MVCPDLDSQVCILDREYKSSCNWETVALQTGKWLTPEAVA